MLNEYLMHTDLPATGYKKRKYTPVQDDLDVIFSSPDKVTFVFRLHQEIDINTYRKLFPSNEVATDISFFYCRHSLGAVIFLLNCNE